MFETEGFELLPAVYDDDRPGLARLRAVMKNDSFRDYVLDQLRQVAGVECRAMFGGFGLYEGGWIFGIVYKGRFYLKAGEKSRPAFIKAGMKPFRPTAKQTLRTYYEVPPEVLENPAELARWVRRA